MKKIVTILALFFLLPVVVFAQDPVVNTLEAEVNNNDISFSGTVDVESHAVMCKLYDDEDNELDMLSVAVDNGEFAGAFTITETGDYRVACANYEGGAFRSDEVTVDEITVTTYTVSFNTNGGSQIADITVNAGDIIEPPEVPHKDGFRFVDWYIDETLTTVFDFDEPINGNTLLYADWEEEQNNAQSIVIHTIFNGEGGAYLVDFYTIDGENQGPISAFINRSAMYTLEAGSPLLLAAEASEGYTFDGWYRVHEEDTDGQGHMEWRRDERLSTDVEYRFTPTENMYISPVFNDNRVFTVHFNTNGGTPLNDVQVPSGELLEEPKNMEKDGFIFGGWYVDDTFTTEYDFNEPVLGELTLYAKWDEDTVPYEVPDEAGNSISFNEEEGHNFEFVIIDLSDLSDEELLELTEGEINKEQYDEALEVLKDAVSDEGTFVAIYEMLVIDENGDPKTGGPFTIKLRMTEEMAKYNSFKLLYVDTDNNFNVEEVIELEAQGDYLVGILQHLSSYVLVGNTVTQTTNNPQTLDNIYISIITLLISIVGLTGTVISAKKLTNK